MGTLTSDYFLTPVFTLFVPTACVWPGQCGGFVFKSV